MFTCTLMFVYFEKFVCQIVFPHLHEMELNKTNSMKIIFSFVFYFLREGNYYPGNSSTSFKENETFLKMKMILSEQHDLSLCII